ncbi:flagellar biosynthesis anti-sigma factor FlgM [Alkalibacillus haloalkaliphilus]|uniref:flagellar biosynthesis anti-sigma factor FlgM n=1 Tax=Alkalibacillus haloalkaliphilus TaxID=94136 RepID=UPI00293684DC|nr:flagellar biosynthesis anti-sigma factor FlgM [Alkalibacillus haloalkaliphilus]MDV2582842.1 flagellar biosynthesis anti-sigma factor FlgM [Alkalibacillus haloalkaliphilus]
MKINPTNKPYLNPYQKQMQNQPMKQSNQQSDKVEISNKAKAMQESNTIEKARQDHVQSIKQQVQDGEYDVDLKKTAEKLLEFYHR